MPIQFVFTCFAFNVNVIQRAQSTKYIKLKLKKKKKHRLSILCEQNEQIHVSTLTTEFKKTLKLY